MLLITLKIYNSDCLSLKYSHRLVDTRHNVQWRNDRVAAASSDGGPTGGRGPPTVLEFLVINFRGPDLRK